MKYNELIRFRESLPAAARLSPSTALTYYNAMSWLLDDQNILDCRKMDVDKVLKKLEAIKHKNDFSKHKSAFLHFCDFLNLSLDKEVIQNINAMNKDKVKKRRKQKAVTLKSINDHIRVIGDMKLKLSFQAMLNSGLRVSEISQIKREDSKIKDDSIEFRFIGKGGNKETVKIERGRDHTLFSRLADLIQSAEQGDKIFYSASYLQAEATKRGFQCHDLRRAFAKTEYKRTRSKDQVRESLRHANMKNTQIYLRSKVKI